MNNRDATSAIKGYLYQFEAAIKTILMQECDETLITLEGIEDIDVDDAEKSTAIQCKYHEDTRYTPSAIRKPINLMFVNFIENYGSLDMNYYLYAYFKENKNTFPNEITITFLKEEIFTFKKSGINHMLHDEYYAEDGQIEEFIRKLKIDINAPEFSEQTKEVFKLIEDSIDCRKNEISYYFNEALSIILKMSVEKDIKLRKITKKEFLHKIKKGEADLYSSWCKKYHSIDEYNKSIKKKYFTKMNHSNLCHVFIIDGNAKKETNEALNAINKITQKYTHNGKRETNRRSPIFCLINFTDKEIVDLKNHLYASDVIIIDGYPYNDTIFRPKEFDKIEKNTNLFRSLTSLEELEHVVRHSDVNFEISIFQLNYINFSNDKCSIRRINIDKISQIEDMV